MIIEEKDERVSLKVTGKEREVIVVQLVFDCILNDVFQLQKQNTSDFSSSCPFQGVAAMSDVDATSYVLERHMWDLYCHIFNVTWLCQYAIPVVHNVGYL